MIYIVAYKQLLENPRSLLGQKFMFKSCQKTDLQYMIDRNSWEGAIKVYWVITMSSQD